MTIKVFLSHDIDYSKTGPNCRHIRERKDRFPNQTWTEWENFGTSLYDNVNDLMKIERDLNVRSTFFFRPQYETGSLGQYSDDIEFLEEGGWEIGLHINDINGIQLEKKHLEVYTKNKIKGSRVHLLDMESKMYPVLKKEGILYDSSICFWKKEFHYQNLYQFKVDGVNVYPVTFMDAFGFTYWNLNENNIISKIDEILKTATQLKNPVFTIDWHDTSLKMFGGRMYEKVLKHLLSKDVKIMRGIDVYEATK